MSAPVSLAEADRRFFLRFPARRYRIRIAARSELEQARRSGALTAPIPEGYRAHVGIKALEHGKLHRVIGVLAEGADCDMTEREARGAYGLLYRQDDAQLTAWAAEHNRQPEHSPRPNSRAA